MVHYAWIEEILVLCCKIEERTYFIIPCKNKHIFKPLNFKLRNSIQKFEVSLCVCPPSPTPIIRCSADSSCECSLTPGMPTDLCNNWKALLCTKTLVIRMWPSCRGLQGPNVSWGPTYFHDLFVYSLTFLNWYFWSRRMRSTYFRYCGICLWFRWHYLKCTSTTWKIAWNP